MSKIKRKKHRHVIRCLLIILLFVAILDAALFMRGGEKASEPMQETVEGSFEIWFLDVGQGDCCHINVGRIDILMIPVGGVYTVDAVTAKRVAESVSPTMIIPMHYRGCGGGLKNIASCDEFTGLFTENMVQYLKNNELIVTKPVTPSVTVFAWRK